MDLRKALGENFDGLGFQPMAYSEEFRSWLADEGEQPDYAVELRDGSLSFYLDRSRRVKTIFVTGSRQIEELLGITQADGFSQVIETFGEPSSRGSEMTVPVLGRKGAWLRYEFAEYAMHVECAVGTNDIRMVTLIGKGAA